MNWDKKTKKWEDEKIEDNIRRQKLPRPYDEELDKGYRVLYSITTDNFIGTIEQPYLGADLIYK